MDELPWNGIAIYGICYNFSIILVMLGIVSDWLKKNFANSIMCTGIVALLTMAMTSPNINRINIVWIPVIYYAIRDNLPF